MLPFLLPFVVVCVCCAAVWCQSPSSGLAYGAGAFALNELLTGVVFVAFLLAAGIYLFESSHSQHSTQSRHAALTHSSLTHSVAELCRGLHCTGVGTGRPVSSVWAPA